MRPEKSHMTGPTTRGQTKIQEQNYGNRKIRQCNIQEKAFKNVGNGSKMQA